MARSAYRYTPALDGLRGVFMACFMAFHFGATSLVGMWIAINMFFVLSGFLITRLLVEEYENFGDVSFWGFYKRRGRRLLPGLFLMLTVVIGWCALFAPVADRSRFGGDVLATTGFFMNWRLIAQGNDYFGDQLNVTPLQHAWTLSIEEQYYLFIPLIVIVLFRFLHSRRSRVVALLVAAAAATAWTAYVASSNPTFGRLYYGTDTRVNALLIGTALGVGFGWSRRRGIPRLPRRWMAAVGWAGLVVMIVFFLTIDQYTAWMYTWGGAGLAALASAALIAGLADSRASALKRLFEWPVAREFGKLTYSLYLWHWPVHVWLGTDRIAGSTLITGVVGFAIATVLAYLSTRFVEDPVLRHGVRGLFPTLRGPMIAVAAPVAAIVAVTSIVLLPSPSGADVVANPTGAIPQLVAGAPAYVPEKPKTIGVVGDSVPWYLVKRFPAQSFPGVTPVNLAHEGCDLLALPQVTATGVKAQTQTCTDAARKRTAALATTKLDVLMLWGSPILAAPHVLPDGAQVKIGQPGFDDALMQAYDTVWKQAKATGAKQVQIVNVPCRVFTAQSAEYDNIQRKLPSYIPEYNQPDTINKVIAAWVAKTPGAKLIDLHAATCAGGTYRAQINGVTLFNDGLHFSPEATPMLWRWLLGQVSQNYAAASH